MKQSFGYTPCGQYWIVKLNVNLSETEANRLSKSWFPTITISKHGKLHRLEGAIRGNMALYEFRSDLKAAKLRTEIAEKQKQLQNVEYDQAMYEDMGVEQLRDSQLT
jgi:hypothetical protein